MENQFSLCISFFICEAEDVNFLPAFINALKRRGGGGEINPIFIWLHIDAGFWV